MNGFATIDCETVPQERYVTPASFSTHGGPVQLDPHWLSDKVGVDQLIQDGGAVLASTKLCPSLHATSCHVVQVSFGLRKESGEINRKILQWDDYAGDGIVIGPDLERCVLQDAFKMLEWAQGGKKCLVGFNSKAFDLPILRARAAILGLTVPVLPWSGTRGLLYPYSDETHCDIRLLLNAGDRRSAGTLQCWAEAFGIKARECGHEVWGWVREGKWSELRQYGIDEAQTLIDLYERIRPVL